MAYANSVMFYGWSGKDATDVTKTLVSENVSQKTKLNEDALKNLNNKLAEFELLFSYFDGGLSSNGSEPYLFFKTVKACQSCGDDDIDENGFTLIEIKEFINLSFQIHKKYPSLVKPMMKNLVVSDTK